MRFSIPFVVVTCAVVLLSTQVTLAKQAEQPDDERTYLVDSSHTSIVFAVSHLGLSYTYGRFNDCEGTIVLNEKMPESSRFDFEIDVDSIDTNEPTRDKHLKGPDFFNVGQFPTIKFQSLRVEKSSQPYEELGVTKQKTVYNALGSMNMHGVSKEISIPLQLIAIGRGPAGKERCGFYSKFVVKRSDFGMDAMANMVGDSIAVTFSFEAIKKEEDKTANLGDAPGNGVQLRPNTATDVQLKSDENQVPEIEEEEPSSPFDVFGEDG
jgi:polyisoprenoid-binding protein YceI